MTSKHTPKTWNYAGRLGYGYIVDPNICVVYGGPGSGKVDDGEANARLISAAPDMFEALVDAEQTIAQLCEGQHEDNVCCHHLRAARAAIAKARGE